MILNQAMLSGFALTVHATLALFSLYAIANTPITINVNIKFCSVLSFV